MNELDLAISEKRKHEVEMVEKENRFMDMKQLHAIQIDNMEHEKHSLLQTIELLKMAKRPPSPAKKIKHEKLQVEKLKFEKVLAEKDEKYQDLVEKSLVKAKEWKLAKEDYDRERTVLQQEIVSLQKEHAAAMESVQAQMTELGAKRDHVQAELDSRMNLINSLDEQTQITNQKHQTQVESMTESHANSVKLLNEQMDIAIRERNQYKTQLESMTENHTSSVKTLKQQIDKLRSDRSEYKTQLKSITKSHASSMNSLKEKIESLIGEKNYDKTQLEAMNKSHASSVKSLKEQIEIITRERNDYNTQVESMTKSHASSVKNLKEQIEGIVKERNQLKTQVESLTDSHAKTIKTLNKEIKELTRDRNNFKFELETIGTKSIEDRDARFAMEKDRLSAEIEALHARHEEATKNSDRKMQTLTEEHSNLQKMLKDMTEQRDVESKVSKECFETLESEHNRLQQKLKGVMQENAKESKLLQEKYSTLTKEYDLVKQQANSTRQKLESENSVANSKCGESEIQIAKLQANIASINEEHQEKCKSLVNQLNSVLQERDELKQNNKSMGEKHSNNREKLERDLNDVMQKLKTQVEQNSTLLQENYFVTAKLKTLEENGNSNAQNIDQKLAEMVQKCIALENDRQGLVQALDTEKQNFQEITAAKDSKYCELEHKHGALLDKLNGYTQDNETLKDKWKTAQDNLSKQKDENKQVMAKYRTIARQFENLESEYAGIKSRFELVKSDLQCMTQKLTIEAADHERQMVDMKDELNAKSKELKNSLEEKEALGANISAMEIQHDTKYQQVSKSHIDLIATCDVQKKEYDALFSKCKLLESKLELANENLESRFRIENVNLKQKCEEMRSELKDQVTRNVQLIEDKENLMVDLEQSQSTSKDKLVKAEAKYTDVLQQLKTSEQTSTELLNRYNALHSQYESVQSIGEKYQASNNELDMVKQLYETLCHEHEVLKSKSHVNDRKFVEMNSDWDRKYKQVQERLDIRSKEFVSATTLVQNLTKSLSDAKRVHQMEMEKISVKVRTESSAEFNEENSRLVNDLATSQRLNVVLRQQIMDLQSDLNVFKSNSETKAAADAKSIQGEQATQVEKAAQAEEAAQVDKSRIVQLETEVASLRVLNSVLDAHVKNMSDSSNNGQSDAYVEQFKIIVANKEKEILFLREQLQAALEESSIHHRKSVSNTVKKSPVKSYQNLVQTILPFYFPNADNNNSASIVRDYIDTSLLSNAIIATFKSRSSTHHLRQKGAKSPEARLKALRSAHVHARNSLLAVLPSHFDQQSKQVRLTNICTSITAYVEQLSMENTKLKLELTEILNYVKSNKSVSPGAMNVLDAVITRIQHVQHDSKKQQLATVQMQHATQFKTAQTQITTLQQRIAQHVQNEQHTQHELSMVKARHENWQNSLQNVVDKIPMITLEQNAISIENVFTSILAWSRKNIEKLTFAMQQQESVISNLKQKLVQSDHQIAQGKQIYLHLKKAQYSKIGEMNNHISQLIDGYQSLSKENSILKLAN